MEGFCRGCLIKYNEPLELLQYTEKNRRLFVYSTGLQVKKKDALTFQLCKDCYLNMKLACKFKKLCRTSDKKYKSYLTLKEFDDTIDLCDFLKSNDDNFHYKFPLLSGSSTPAHQKSKDDDNESTCTSIRNFMTDMLQGEEMPDTEARIIKEVIEEEADLLEYSLDSHWLQDDVSIDTDFRLDISFSPFATPRSVNNDHCYTPKKWSDQNEHERLNYYTSKAIMEKPDKVEEEKIVNEAVNNIPDKDDENLLEHLLGSPKNDIIMDVVVDGVSSETMGINAHNYYVQRDIFEEDLENNVMETDNENIDKTNGSCSIDRNLEMALKDDGAKEFTLEDLLFSPPVFPDVSPPATPTINNILFGDKLDSVSPNNQNKIGQCIENFQNVVREINTLDDFFNSSKEFDPNEVTKTHMEECETVIKDEHKIDNKEIVIKEEHKIDNKEKVIKNEHKIDNKEIVIKDESKIVNGDQIMDKDLEVKVNKYQDLINKEIKTILEKMENKEIIPWLIKDNFDVDNLHCKLCDKKLVSLRALQLHASKLHNMKITKVRKKYSRKKYSCQPKICDLCGKKYRDASSLIKHKKRHNEPVKVHKCEVCSIVCTNQAKLNQHKRSHGQNIIINKEKKYMCTICGVKFSTSGNLKIHQRRHDKNYSLHCTECGKGFYRSSDLTHHMRWHTQEKPHECPHCDRCCARLDELVNHIKIRHLNPKKFICDCCNLKFKKKSELVKHIKKQSRLKSRIKKAVKNLKKIYVAESNLMVNSEKELVIKPILVINE